MFNQNLDRVSELLEEAKQAAILVGENPGLDDMAAACALCLALEKVGKKAVVVCKTPPSVALGNVVGIDKVKQTPANSSGGLIISLPYQQGEIEKISYDIVGDKIKLTVVPGERGLGFTTDDITFQTPSETVDVVFSIGINSENEVMALYPSLQETPLVNIDMNAQNSGFGSVSLVDSSYSSNCEIVAKILMLLTLPVDIDTAQNLVSGIVEKTVNFQSEATSPFAFEATAFLMQKGARRERRKSLGTIKSRFTTEEKDSIIEEDRTWAKVMKTPKPAKLQEKTAPKDWLEPKIYKGSSVPIS
ncbi:hypothetical protein HYT17_02865 [Candidatus Microgenomates bacterium]|nr:hypothetical protein [Candidatus Microgenomates bacterium]